MRVLSIRELMRLRRIELTDLLIQVTNALPDMPEGSVERQIALINLRNIRWVLARHARCTRTHRACKQAVRKERSTCKLEKPHRSCHGRQQGDRLRHRPPAGEEGIRILVSARDPHRGEAGAAELRSKCLAVRYVQIDLTDPVTISDAVADIEAHEKRLDILINNAAITSAGDGAPSAANIEAVGASPSTRST